MIRWPTVVRDHKGNVVVADVEYRDGKAVTTFERVESPAPKPARKTAKGRIRPRGKVNQ